MSAAIKAYMYKLGDLLERVGTALKYITSHEDFNLGLVVFSVVCVWDAWSTSWSIIAQWEPIVNAFQRLRVFLGFHVLTLIVGPIVANFEKYTKYAVLATLGFHVSQSLVLGTNFFRAGEMLIAVSAVLTYLYPRDMPRYAAHA